MRTYLDHNATCPLIPEALEAMLPFLREGAANASSTHWEGQRARHAIEEAREEVARLAGAAPSEIVFTSGGTEADNAAIVGAALAASAGASPAPGTATIVSTTLEHPAVHRPLRALEGRGFGVLRIGPSLDGVVDAAEVLEATRPGTILVSVEHVNSEIGTIQPVEAIAEGCLARGVLFHTDAVQAAGRLSIPPLAGLTSLSAHKIGGPQGVGALVVRRGTLLEPLLRGGPQETRRRAGTENVAGIVGFGAAARLARERLSSYAPRVGALRDGLEKGLAARFPGVSVHGARAPRVANTSCFSIPGLEGAALQMALDLECVSVSTGSACASGKTAPSYVLAAIGASEESARGALRVSLGWGTTRSDVERFLDALARVVDAQRDASSGSVPPRGGNPPIEEEPEPRDAELPLRLRVRS